jgi:hypothetical protein
MEKAKTVVSHENLILFDWLTFTSHSDSPETVMQLLGLKDVPWQKMEKGRNGYKCRYFFENISILYDGAENMGVCVDMSGSGCRAFETYSTIDWKELMDLLFYNADDYNVTRLDMAFDDHTGILDIDELRDDTDEHLYVSRSRTWKVEYGSAGTTIYHGSPTSNTTALLDVIRPEMVCVCCCCGSDEYTDNVANMFPSQDFVNKIAPYTDKVYVTTIVDDSKEGYTSMNGNIIVYYDKLEKVQVRCSNNATLFKDTNWFKNNRTMPDAWKSKDTTEE